MKIGKAFAVTVSASALVAERRNAVIADINFPPRNANGKVEYTTSFTIIKPVDMTKASWVSC